MVRATAAATRHHQPLNEESPSAYPDDAPQLGMAQCALAPAVLSANGKDAGAYGKAAGA